MDTSQGPGRRVARIWAASWLPLLLVGLAVMLAPVVDDFLLCVFLLMLAHASTWVPDLVRKIPWPNHRPRSRGTGSRRGAPEG